MRLSGGVGIEHGAAAAMQEFVIQECRSYVNWSVEATADFRGPRKLEIEGHPRAGRPIATSQREPQPERKRLMTQDPKNSAVAEASRSQAGARATHPTQMRPRPEKPDSEKRVRGTRGRPFEKGRSGNPAGRPLGSRNAATKAAELLLAGEAEALTRKAIDLALAGDPLSLRLCLERILPLSRDRTVSFRLRPIKEEEDLLQATADILAAVANGDLTPAEANAVSRIVELRLRSIEASNALREELESSLLRYRV